MLGSLVTTRSPGDIALAYMRRSPPTDLMGLAADLGISIQYENKRDFSGKIEKVTNEAGNHFLITLNELHAPTRQRFTLAHELAHFIKHRRQLEAGGIIDNALYRSLLPEPMEWEANRYAAQLLMPLSAMEKLWMEGLREPANYAERMGVSAEAARIRLDQLRGSLALMGRV